MACCLQVGRCPEVPTPNIWYTLLWALGKIFVRCQSGRNFLKTRMPPFNWDDNRQRAASNQAHKTIFEVFHEESGSGDVAPTWREQCNRMCYAFACSSNFFSIAPQIPDLLSGVTACTHTVPVLAIFCYRCVPQISDLDLGLHRDRARTQCLFISYVLTRDPHSLRVQYPARRSTGCKRHCTILKLRWEIQRPCTMCSSSKKQIAHPFPISWFEPSAERPRVGS